MEMINFNELYELVKQKKYRELKEKLSELNVVDIAEFIEGLKPDKVITAFRMLPKEKAAETFSFLSIDMQHHIISSITDREIAEIIEDLFVDDAVDLLEELPANVVKRVLRNATEDTRKLINQFLQYPEDSAGSIMTAEFVNLKKNMTVEDAFLRIRRTGIDKETVYTCYVTDDNLHLEGFVTVKRLFLSKDNAIIGDIMDKNVISVNTADPAEEVAMIFSKYGFLSLPVVDNENRLVGIVTFDDAAEIIEQETTEDFQIMAAMLPSERPYLKTSVFTLAKNRIPWLLILMFSATITGLLLEKYEHTFAAIPLLVSFLPMLIDTGGNAGCQSSTLVIRGMIISEIRIRDIFKVVYKEFKVSIIVGVALAAANYIRLIIMYPGKEMIVLTVCLSLFFTVIMSKTVGAMLPMLAKVVKLDPAIMAAPLITTIVDAFGVLIYFSIAVYLLGL